MLQGNNRKIKLKNRAKVAARRRLLRAGTVATIAAMTIGAGGALAFEQLADSAPLATSEQAQELLSGGNDDIDVASIAQSTPDLEMDFYMLLLGTDASDERRGGAERKAFTMEQGGDFRADAITLAHVNLETHDVTLCSFDRDLKSVITGYEKKGYQKLNAAYQLGGAETMKAEIEELTGIDIPYVAVVDMTALETVVDAIGGIDVDIEEAFWDTQLEDGFKRAGVQHLDGYQALLYSRARHAFADGTVSRARHQRQVLQAIGAKMKKADLPGLYSSVAGVSGQVATNLTLSQLYELGQALKEMDWDDDVHMLQSPTVGCLDGEVWYSFMLRDDWKKMVVKLVANDGKEPSAKSLKKIKVKTDAVYADETPYYSGMTTAE